MDSLIPAPGGGGVSGITWAEGTLWVGSIGTRRSIKSTPQIRLTISIASPLITVRNKAGLASALIVYNKRCRNGMNANSKNK
jgi:hypothetical protein